MSGVLETEIQTFEAQKRAWLAAHEGEFALIRGTTVTGFFATRGEALRAGYDKFGLVPFLVREVEAETEPVHFATNLAPPADE